MSGESSETKTAVISISKALLGLSFATIAALGGLSGAGWIAVATALPGAGLGAVDSLNPLIQRLKGKKAEHLELPMPNWWSRRNDSSWQSVCTAIEGQLPDVMRATIEVLKTETRIPTAPIILSTFTSEIERCVPRWDVQSNERGLVADAVARPFLERIAQVFKTEVSAIQQDALAKKVEEIATGLAVLAAVRTPELTLPAATMPGVPQAQTAPEEQLRQKFQQGIYDVYICYQKDDEIAVKEIDHKLKNKGILPWFDRLTLAPGSSTQTQQDEQIKKIGAAAVFIGKQVLGHWQTMEIEALIREFTRREFLRIIPVYLPDAPPNPELSVFLENFAGVDFRQSDPDPFAYLIWGITGQRPSIF